VAARLRGPSCCASSPATAIADAEGEVDLDTVRHEVAPPEEVPAGIPVEHEEGPDAA